MAASAPMMMMGRSEGMDGMEDERRVEGREPLLDHMLKWKKGGRGCGRACRAGVAVMGCKWKIYRGKIVWEELEGLREG